jgi:hypothetical protein
MATEIHARPVNWCPQAERRRRRGRAVALVVMLSVGILWITTGIGQ